MLLRPPAFVELQKFAAGRGIGGCMVTSIARQSVIIKCNMQKSILTGNYEYYYAAGLLSRLAGFSIDDGIRPQELQEQLQKETEALDPKDEREAYLLRLLRDYKPQEEYDGQMKELLMWGKQESDLWTVIVPGT